MRSLGDLIDNPDPTAPPPPPDAVAGPGDALPCCGGTGVVRLPVGTPRERTWERYEQDDAGVRRPVTFTETYQPTVLQDCEACKRTRDTVERRLALSGLDQPYGGWETWRTSPHMAPATSACLDLLTDGARSLVFMRSGVGSGKTKLAQVVGVEGARAGLTVAFWNVADLLDAIRHTYGPNAEQEEYDFLHGRVYNRDLVILDDIGTVKPTPWAMAITFDIVNNLYRRRDRTRLIVTTNVPPGGEYDQAAGGEIIEERVLSRLRPGEVAIQGAPDRRREFER